MNPLRYIIVGTGGFGGHWCSAYLPRLAAIGKAVATAAVDLNPDARKHAQQTLNLPPERTFADMNEAFDKATDADFAIVVVPPAHHEKVVDAALAHNLHVLSEKPIADTMDACCRIYHKINRAGRKMAVTMSHRFDQDKQTLEKMIKSGEYGGLSYLVGRNTWNSRKFGTWGKFRHEIPDTLLIEGTVHHFDIIRALSGADGKTVYAITWNPPWGEFAGDSCGLIAITMTNGVKVIYEGNKASAATLNGWCNDYFRAECDRATIELDNRRVRVISDLSGERVIVEKPLLQQEVWLNGWLAEMFCDWLRGGPAPPNTIQDNMQCAALTFAAIESAHTGKIVDVQDFLKQKLAAAT